MKLNGRDATPSQLSLGKAEERRANIQGQRSHGYSPGSALYRQIQGSLTLVLLFYVETFTKLTSRELGDQSAGPSFRLHQGFLVPYSKNTNIQTQTPEQTRGIHISSKSPAVNNRQVRTTWARGHELITVMDFFRLDQIFGGHLVQPLAQAETSRAGCTGLCPDGF